MKLRGEAAHRWKLAAYNPNQPKTMKRSRKERAYLRALLGPEGEGGEIRREFGKGLTPKEQRAVRRELEAHPEGEGAPSQVQEMREAARDGKKTRAKGAAAQVEEMRKAAATPPLPTL